MKQKCLMLGAGHLDPFRQIKGPDSAPEESTEWWTLDMNKDSNPKIHFNLDRIESWILWWNRIPVKAETFDEIHAYQVMEHYGKQGNFKGLFRGMRELWRILKPGGWLIGSSPYHSAMWAWGDPGHTRVITRGTFIYLERKMYKNLGRGPESDYRKYVDPCWWELRESSVDPNTNGYFFGLQKSE